VDGESGGLVDGESGGQSKSLLIRSVIDDLERKKNKMETTQERR